MNKDKKQESNKTKKNNKLNIKISGLDIDKAEYQEIVMSQSNYPDNFYNN